MKRNMDLIREILFKIEELPLKSEYKLLEIKNYNQDEIIYHLLILHEAGLIVAHIANYDQETLIYPKRLTWSGHEFLESAKNNGPWNEAKNFLKEKAISVPFALFEKLINHFLGADLPGFSV